MTYDDPQSELYVLERAQSWPALRLVKAERGHSVAAYNAGLGSASSLFVAFTDDDAVPAPDWLERIVIAFGRDERIAAVGGRDLIVMHGRPLPLPQRRGRPPQVGRIQGWGGV